MSPLARSLLVLAVLFATDGKVINNNEPPGSRCTGITIVVIPVIINSDRMLDITFEFQSKGDETLHEVVDHCKPHGLRVASETVRACNGYHLPSASNWFAPSLRALGDETLSPVHASCERNPECKPIKFHVIQTCIQ